MQKQHPAMRIKAENIFLTILIVLIAGMNFKALKAQSLINYDTLNRLKLQTAVTISASEDYFPGDFGKLLVDSDGFIIAKDVAKTTIEQFDPRGNHLATVARGGPGPGEIHQSSSLLSITDDTLIIDFYEAHIHSLFAKGPEGIYRHVRSLSYEDPRGGIMNIYGSQSPDRFFLITFPFRELVRKGLDGPEKIQLAVDLVNKKRQIIQDSLHLLNLPTRFIDLHGGNITRFSPSPYQHRNFLKVFNDRSYLIARADSSSLHFYNSSHALVKKVSLQTTRRPLKGEIDYSLYKGFRNKVREEMISRLPEYKPPFLDIWVSDSYLWMKTDINRERKEFIVLNLEGVPLGKFYLKASQEIQKAVDNRIYITDDETDSGSAIIVYQVNI